MSDAINKPAHYNQGLIECIEAMKIVLTPEEFRGYLKGNVFKYLWREKDKNGIEDLRKAKWYLNRLVDSLDEYEQQKSADLQSLKDHPFGKLKQPKWTPKVGDWVRIKNIDPREAWMPGMDKYDGKIVQVEEFDGRSIVHDEWCFLFDWLEPAEQPKPTLNSDKIPKGYRKLNDSSEEPRQIGDLRWSVAEKRYVEISGDEIGYANRDNWAACRKVAVEVTGEVAGEAETEWVDAVWPEDWGKPARFWPNPIYPGEGAPDYVLWELGTLAGYVGYVVDVYRPWIMEVNGKISCQMYCRVKKEVGTKEQPTELHGGLRPNDNVALAMRMAANSFGGNDGVFNGAGFANAMRQLAGVTCNLDGYVVATILEGRSDVEVLKGGSHYRYLFYESINSLQETAEPPEATLNSDTIPEGYRKLNYSSEEPRQIGDLRWSVAAKRYVEISVDEIGYANRNNWAACRKIEPVVKQPLNTEPPDGWRFLEVGEVIRKGDRYFDGNKWKDRDWAVKETYSLMHQKTIRRNRFEVGEKVLDCRAEVVFTVQHFDKEQQIVFIDGVSKGIESKHLAPYIEETK